MNLLGLFFATYGAVFAAEIVGDKLLYTTGVLATRYRSTPIMVGMGIAFAVKMAVAVMVGEAIAHLPRFLVAGLTTASFIGVAIMVWRKPDVRPEYKVKRDQERASKAAAVSFAAIFFSEWGDVGQITAATMAARYPSPLFVVWLGAFSAMVTKGILAAFLGASVREWIHRHLAPKTVRYASVVALSVLCIAAVVEELMRGA
ncbi:MAG TPA: TMEM165/GDT1 family protein [Gemmatimonadaceae bacterium]|nr:TMEM165/GDT1 family protein [Gemmatimonadaceae bacterium]